MSKLTELLKAGDVKYLQRDSWGNSKVETVLLEFDVDTGIVRECTWYEEKTPPVVRTVYLTLEEALADDWEIVEPD
ncbi:hypothetical protein NVX19_003507 [Salmonella enterica]|uniref:Transcriptional regulator n=1 Tax=Salmonella phage GSW6 TaxID=3025422 RepID=A0AAE9YKM7_9CAUD|nr:hypothetical protein [Salmonella enterica]WCX68638.1 transcriptional regulator [Salmonella phage GSW6]